MSGCGDCSMCCKLIEIADPLLNKPPNIWCKNCNKAGCKIYDSRPDSCRKYECVYLQSQTDAHPLPVWFRPDACKVIFDITENNIFAIARVESNNVKQLESPEVKLLMSALQTQHSIIASTGRRKKIIHLTPAGAKFLQEQNIDINQKGWFKG